MLVLKHDAHASAMVQHDRTHTTTGVAAHAPRQPYCFLLRHNRTWHALQLCKVDAPAPPQHATPCPSCCWYTKSATTPLPHCPTSTLHRTRTAAIAGHLLAAPSFITPCQPEKVTAGCALRTPYSRWYVTRRKTTAVLTSCVDQLCTAAGHLGEIVP
jgi:hypothetical protein